MTALSARSLSVPPSIVPFPPSAQFEEGQRTRLLCGLARADPPVTFTWRKDGVEIRGPSGQKELYHTPLEGIKTSSELVLSPFPFEPRPIPYKLPKKAGILGPFDRTDPLLAEAPSSRSLPFVKITTNLDDFSSLLTFVTLRSAEHSGNYTCVAENAAGKAEYTARISVKGIHSYRARPAF